MSVLFDLDEKVVYPSHGVAKIDRIVEKTISGRVATFYELKFLSKNMTILVPMHNLESIGIRRLSSQDMVQNIFSFLGEIPTKALLSDNANWKHRNKEYQIKLRTGSLFDVSQVYKDLKYIEQHKQLSFCEKNLLLQTEALLVEEISLVKRIGEDKTMEHLRSLFMTSVAKESPLQQKIVQNIL